MIGVVSPALVPMWSSAANVHFSSGNATDINSRVHQLVLVATKDPMLRIQLVTLLGDLVVSTSKEARIVKMVRFTCTYTCLFQNSQTLNAQVLVRARLCILLA
eukprot:SAG31_NODE_796_length_12032_cov_21.073242_4_plen_103_part_00